jgi:hypothetical protein
MGKMMLFLAFALATGANAGERANGFKIVFHDAVVERPGGEMDELIQSGKAITIKSGKFVESYSFGKCGRDALDAILSDFEHGTNGAGGCNYASKRGVIEVIVPGRAKQEIAWCRGSGYPFPMIAMALEKCSKRDK